MIIENIVINNFKNYGGTVTVDLTPTDGKNIILLGGSNGSGKTTFVESIKLCLYGQYLNGERMSDKAYQTYLNDVLNKNAEDKFSLEMSLNIGDMCRPRPIKIKRSFKRVGKRYIEDFEIVRGQSSVDHISEEYWSYYVENLIPPKIAQYFFFDGENVRNIISSEESGQFLSEALDSMAGVSELETLKNDLEKVRKRILSKESSKTSKKAIGKMEGEISYQKRQIEDVESKIDVYKTAEAKLSSEKELCNQELRRLAGRRENIIKNLEVQKNNHSKELSITNGQILDFCMDALPFLIASDLLERTLEQATTENRKIIYSNAKMVINEIGSDLHKSFGKDIDALSSLIKIISDAIDEKSDSEVKHILNLSQQQIAIIDQKIKSPGSVKQFLYALEKRESLSEEIRKSECALRNSNLEQASEIVEKIRDLDKDIDFTRKLISALEDDIVKHEDNIVKLEMKIREEEKKTLLKDLDAQMVMDVESAIMRILDKISELRGRAQKNFLSSVNEVYSELKNKEDMVGSISLNEKNEIIMADTEGRPVNTLSLSEGEKTILMYSVIYGLHRISIADLPVVIDSPLGRLDSIHTHNLVNYLYPILGDQIIILAHDRELTREDLNSLEDHLSKKYLIKEKGPDKIVKGYFGDLGG